MSSKRMRSQPKALPARKVKWPKLSDVSSVPKPRWPPDEKADLWPWLGSAAHWVSCWHPGSYVAEPPANKILAIDTALKIEASEVTERLPDVLHKMKLTNSVMPLAKHRPLPMRPQAAGSVENTGCVEPWNTANAGAAMAAKGSYSAGGCLFWLALRGRPQDDSSFLWHCVF